MSSDNQTIKTTGQKIKTVSHIFITISLVTSLIMLIVAIIQLLYLPYNPEPSWLLLLYSILLGVGSFIPYYLLKGFGEIVDNIAVIKTKVGKLFSLYYQ